ncbi:response regulator [Deinococcus apachensis]|uniref:response regulator n=1 Tax=Deinococcus apachensis TaxID=309886 RepID=UPI0003681751|nr:response regulator [Deinococcus apachensis]
MTPPDALPARVLLIEDTADEALLIRRALAERGVRDVTVIPRGTDALDYLYRRGAYTGRGEDDPDLILLDLGLPDMSGLEVLEAIRASAALRHVPVVVLTVSAQEADRGRSYETGASLFITKPAHPAEFTATVRAISSFWLEADQGPS